YPHSVWQIVSHMNYWMDYELRRIAGQRPAHPEHAIESWPAELGPTSEADWNSARKELAARLEQFAALSESTPDMLRAGRSDACGGSVANLKHGIRAVADPGAQQLPRGPDRTPA